MGQSVFDANSAQIEFMNNTIKIKREDPSQRRDFIILKSWTGALLGICSVMCTIFSLVRLLPAIYGSGCHIAGTWNLSRYPGATFALIESLTSLAFLALLILAAFLSVILDYIPRFFLRTVPQSMRHCRRRMHQKWNPKMAWTPNSFELDLEQDQKNKGEEGDGTNEYDCS